MPNYIGMLVKGKINGVNGPIRVAGVVKSINGGVAEVKTQNNGYHFWTVEEIAENNPQIK